MPAPLLDTKLYLPSSRPGLVARPRLGERLDRGTTSKLTLVSSPAGFGKTTLLAHWLTQWLRASNPPADPRSGAWLSLDRGDNDPASFWAYVIAALRRTGLRLGASALGLLQGPQAPPIEAVLTALINDFGAIEMDIVLVLDDFHLIEASDVHDQMAFLLNHLPPRLHLVIASRSDPPLPLARLRARGELVEARAADLRFTSEEAAAYLNGTMGLSLTAQDVFALQGRTEGWIAALQLAALSMQGRDDPAGFIAGFTGDDRYIVDYLAEEVLLRQPEQVQSFLLQTSILERLSGPLCDAVTREDDGKSMLEGLDRDNLFLFPLDDRRQWYRYHHLFADVLRARLSDEQPDQVPVLHRRASDWWAQSGDRGEAIGHAMAGGHLERAADLVELAMPSLRRDRREATLRGWLEELPDEVVQVRPVLANGYAGALLATGDVEGVEPLLRVAERWLDAPPGGMVVGDDTEFHRLPGGIAIHRAGQALMMGDRSATTAHARRALDLLGDDDHVGRGAASALIGLAAWAEGDLKAAGAAYATSAATLRRAGHLSDVLGCSIAQADIQITQGRLREAARTYDEGLRLALEHGSPLRGTADMYVGISALQRERNDLQAARESLTRSNELGEHAGLPQNLYRWRVAMARIREAEGDLDGALALLDEAERLYVGDFSPDVRPVPAMRARVWTRQGRFDDALDWAGERGLSVDYGRSYLHEFEHVTLARVLIARAGAAGGERALDAVIELLERLLDAAATGHRTGSVIEILVLQALAHQLQGDLMAALGPLERALTLAEPEGYVRVFVDEGPPMTTLLETTSNGGETASTHARRLLAALATAEVGTLRRPQLVEPLSERERHVLRLLGTELTGPEIARELMVSVNTVRSHTQRIYAKLGVNNRRAAVRRAQELDVLRGSRDRPS